MIVIVIVILLQVISNAAIGDLELKMLIHELIDSPFSNTPGFWLNLQQRNDIWTALNTEKRKKRIDQAKPIKNLAA